MKQFLLVIFLVMPLTVIMGQGQEEAEKQDIWEPFQFLIGQWMGTGEGKSGESYVRRDYRYKFDRKFIYYHNRAVFKPSEKNRKGEIHEDFGVLSYDKIHKLYVFRQFHREGFVNQYVVEFSADGRTVTFTSENLENSPPGWKVRLVIQNEGTDKISERFELAGPGKEFGCLMTNRLTRVDAR